MKKPIQHTTPEPKSTVFGKQVKHSAEANYVYVSGNSNKSSANSHKIANKDDEAFAKAYGALAKVKMALDSIYLRNSLA